MSLRFRLSLMLAVLFVLIFIGSSAYIIYNARDSVEEEIQAAAKMTLELIGIAIGNAAIDSEQSRPQDVLNQIMQMESSRHVDIDILARTNLDRYFPPRPTLEIDADAPGWFIKLVEPASLEYRRMVHLSNGQLLEVIVRSSPSDEISEVWRETRIILISIIILFMIAIVIVFITLGKGLAPIETIIHGLDEIQQGNYKKRLPEFSTPELTRISRRFNGMAEKLATTEEDNRILTEQSLNIQEQERRNLAHELHDHLGQSITAIKAVAASISMHDADQSIKDSINAILDISNTMYDSARSMIRRLRPLVLDELGLIKTLQDMIDDWNSHHEELFCHFTFQGEFDDINEKAKITIYRIVQESLTNVVKHAHAQNVYVNLHIKESGAGNSVSLEIHDDGKGFDPEMKMSGLGIRGMKERVHSLGGVFKITCNKGTQIDLTIPLKDAAGEE